MSKVKNIPDELCTPKLKEKYRSGLRRIKSEKIKNRRMKNAKKFRCGYRYYLKDSLTIHERVEINVPERTRAKYHWEVIKNKKTLVRETFVWYNISITTATVMEDQTQACIVQDSST